MVYDVTRKLTFENCIKWYNELKYGMTDCKNIIKDTTMLGSVYGGFNYCFGNYPYILLQYMDDGKYTLEFPEFQTLHTMWGQLIKNQIEWKRKEE